MEKKRINIVDDVELLRYRPKEAGDFTRNDPWRVLRIQGEVVNGFDNLSDLESSVAIFGSARILPDNRYYQEAEKVAGNLSNAGLNIITGGGPGIMEAANKGAMEGRALSVGCNIELPFEQKPNSFQDISLSFRYFFVRKLMFVKYSVGFIIFPGGFGTMDELFEALTLSQCDKILHFPIVLHGKEYWAGLLDWVRKTLLVEGCISEKDIELLKVTDSIEETSDFVLEYCYQKGYLKKANT